MSQKTIKHTHSEKDWKGEPMVQLQVDKDIRNDGMLLDSLERDIDRFGNLVPKGEKISLNLRKDGKDAYRARVYARFRNHDFFVEENGSNMHSVLKSAHDRIMRNMMRERKKNMRKRKKSNVQDFFIEDLEPGHAFEQP